MKFSHLVWLTVVSALVVACTGCSLVLVGGALAVRSHQKKPLKTMNKLNSCNLAAQATVNA